jgi:hypothetical protein
MRAKTGVETRDETRRHEMRDDTIRDDKRRCRSPSTDAQSRNDESKDGSRDKRRDDTR